MDIRHCPYQLFLVAVLLCITDGQSNMDDDYEDMPSSTRCAWIRNKLKNGRVRLRYKGRVAKFICDSGFELAGKRSSTCVRGQWSNPVPVCVARGCRSVPPIPNGRITEMYRGALLVYDCNPGYSLDGETNIHCDGRRWSGSAPACVVTTENPETYCDFESPDLCGWSHDTNHDFDWKRNQFATPSGHVGTGPAFDHTFGENKGGFYLFIEASSPRKLNDTARLFSPVYPADLSGGCFVFWYHMYGATTGGLRVYLKPESHVFDELRPNWEKFGDQGNQWLRGNMIVPVLHENFQIVIEGIRGESYVGDSAIDDVRLSPNICEMIGNTTDVAESTAQDSCRGRCRETGSDLACGCNGNCLADRDCCHDYFAMCTAGNETLMQNTDEPLPGDYFGKTSSLVTATIFQTTESAFGKTSSPVTDTFFQTTEGTFDKTDVVTGASVIRFSSTASSLSTVSSTTEEAQTSFPITGIPSISSTENFHQSSSSLKEESTSTRTTELSTTSIGTSSLTTQSTPMNKYSSPPIVIQSSTVSEKPSKSTFSSTTFSTVYTKSTHTSSKSVEKTTQTTVGPKPSTFSITTQSTNGPTNSTMSTTTQTPSTAAASATTTSTTPKYITLTSQPETSSSTQPSVNTSYASPTTLSSTRKTYNLRPRTRQTTPTSNTTHEENYNPTSLERKDSTKFSTSSSTVTSTSTTKTTTPSTTKTTTQSTPKTTMPSTTPKTSTTTETTTLRISQTTKLPFRFTKSTEKTPRRTADSFETGASKAETASSNGSAPIVISLVVIMIICVVAGSVYFVKRQRNKRQSKLSDDSEMRFLPESDYNMEYSDASALDRIMVK